jgi:hypothetical protein
MSGDYDELTEEERKRLYGERKFVGKVSRTKTGGISIDVSGISDAVNEEELEAVESETLERVKADRDDLKAKLQLIAEKQFEKTKKELGAPEEFETVEELEAWKREHAEMEKSSREYEREVAGRNPALNPELGAHAGSGKAPLSGEPSGNLSTVKEFSTVAEMASEIQRRMHSNNPEIRAEAEEIQKKLLEKMAKEKKSHNFEVEIDLGKIAEDKRKKDEELRRRGAKTVNWSEL